MLLRVRARLRGGARADRARHRDLPPRRRRRGREQRRHPRARPALSADRALGRARRHLAPRDPAGAERRRDRGAAVPPRAALRAEPARHRLGDRRLPRDPDRPTAATRRRWPRSSCSSPRASSRSRSPASSSRSTACAEQWEKLVKIYEVQLDKLTGADERMRSHPADRRDRTSSGSSISRRAFVWWAQAVREAPRSELAIEEVERLAEACHTWEDLVGIYTQVLERARRRLARRSGTCCRGWRASTRTELRDNAQGRRVVPAGAVDRSDRRATRSPRSTASTTRRGDVRRSSPRSSAGASASPRPPTRSSSSTSACGARARPRRSTTRPRRSRRTTPSSSNDSRNRRALESLERVYFHGEEWQELFDTYEKMVDIAPGDEEMADCYARMAKIASGRRSTDREKAVDLWGRVIDLRGEDPIALGELANLHERAEQWRELVDVLERDGAHHARSAGADPALSAPGSHLGREAAAASATRSRRGRRSSRSIRPTSWRCARWRRSTSRRRRGRSWSRRCTSSSTSASASDMEPTEMIELYAELGQLAGRDPRCARRRRSTPGSGCCALNDRDFRALGGARAAVHARGALGGVHRRPRAARRTSLDDADRRRSRCCSRPRRCGRTRSATATARATSTSASSQLDASEHDGVAAARADLSRAVELGEAHRAPARARRVHAPSGADRVQILQTGRQDLREGDRRPGGRVRRAPGGVQARTTPTQAVSRELERLATATNKWNELLDEYTQIVQHDPRAEDRRPDLWVKIGRWYGEHLGHLEYAIALGAAGAALEPEPHRGARGTWPASTASVDVAGADRDARSGTPSRRGRAGEEGRAVPARWPSCSRARSAIRRRRSRAYQSALDADPASLDALDRARAALPPHRAVAGARSRSSSQEGGRARGHRGGHPAQASRSVSSSRSGSATRGRRSRPTRRSSRSIRRTSRR